MVASVAIRATQRPMSRDTSYYRLIVSAKLAQF